MGIVVNGCPLVDRPGGKETNGGTHATFCLYFNRCWRWRLKVYHRGGKELNTRVPAAKCRQRTQREEQGRKGWRICEGCIANGDKFQFFENERNNEYSHCGLGIGDWLGAGGWKPFRLEDWPPWRGGSGRQEQQLGQLLDVVSIGHAIVTQDVGIAPHALDNGGGWIGYELSCSILKCPPNILPPAQGKAGNVNFGDYPGPTAI